jgi:hypothetical protein
MKTLSPKALRFIAVAMRYASDGDRALWAAMDIDTSDDIPLPAARAAFNALTSFERRLRERLDQPGLDENETADLSNDLGFVTGLVRGRLRDAVHPAAQMEAAD